MKFIFENLSERILIPNDITVDGGGGDGVGGGGRVGESVARAILER